MAAGESFTRPPIFLPRFRVMCRLTKALQGSPMVPSSIERFTYANFGLNRCEYPMVNASFFEAASAINSSASASSRAIGFSRKTCLAGKESFLRNRVVCRPGRRRNHDGADGRIFNQLPVIRRGCSWLGELGDFFEPFFFSAMCSSWTHG